MVDINRNYSMTIALREITFATVREIIGLRVSEQQSRYVAPNATSIAEGHLNPGAWPRAIYADNTPVGFIMLLDPNVPGAIMRSAVGGNCIVLWRLMIDHQYQKRGFAKQALDLVCSRARGIAGTTALLTSYVPGEHGPECFYLSYGFQKTGLLRANGTEVELRLDLTVCPHALTDA